MNRKTKTHIYAGFGAFFTGKTGTLAVEAALSAGYQVVTFVRRPEAVPARERLIIIGGSVENPDANRINQ